VRDIDELKKIAAELRQDVVRMVYLAGSGHPGGSLSSAEIITALYFGGILHVDPRNPKDPDRDRFILSKGHCCPILYAALARKGFFEVKELDTLRKYHSILQGHPDMNKTPGIDMTSGSLGNGLSAGLGMALSGRIHHQTYKTYVLMGDGELQEGSVWEAAMAASHHHAENLIGIVDCNHLQINGKVEDIMNIEPLRDKWEAFGWKVLEAEGNDMAAVVDVLSAAAGMEGPTVILANTVKGKGVPFMENLAVWHGKAPNEKEYLDAISALKGGIQS